MSIPMEVTEMDEGESESHLTSPAAFVEGGIQEACDDSCSICLEAFCDSDPGTVTSCKHEFHLQCILEWCQRSSNCPMCWQAISLKDPASQELLEAVEQERSLRFNPPRNSTIFHHPTLGDFELQHLPFGVDSGELEDRIIQHLAAAAAMGRTHHIGRREGSRNRSSAHARPQFLVFSNAPSPATESPSVGPGRGEAEPASATLVAPLAPITAGEVESVQPMSTQQTAQVSNSQQGTSAIHRTSSSQSNLLNQDRAGPSEFQAVADSWKSRFNAISTRYKESLSKSTRGWKERLFNRSPSSNTGSDARRETSAEITNVTGVMERLELRDDNQQHDSVSSSLADNSPAEEHNHDNVESRHETVVNGNNSAGAGAASN